MTGRSIVLWVRQRRPSVLFDRQGWMEVATRSPVGLLFASPKIDRVVVHYGDDNYTEYSRKEPGT